MKAHMILFNVVMITGADILLWFMCVIVVIALEEIGGIAVETVTEDAHCA